MAKFVSETYKSLIIPGAGQFEDGVLEVTGKAATVVRKIVKGGQYGVEEVKGQQPKATDKSAEEEAKNSSDPGADDQGAEGDPDAEQQ